jgi:hypothetical protein
VHAHNTAAAAFVAAVVAFAFVDDDARHDVSELHIHALRQTCDEGVVAAPQQLVIAVVSVLVILVR